MCWILKGRSYDSQLEYERALREDAHENYLQEEAEHRRKYNEAVRRYRESGESYSYTADGRPIIHN